MSAPSRRSLYGMLAAFRRRAAAASASPMSSSWPQQQSRRAFAADADVDANTTEPTRPLGFIRGSYSPADFPPDRIRNFSIIAHVDHGKSTLADALMKRLGAIAPDARAQFLDRLEVERTRGITVKSASASLVVPAGTVVPAAGGQKQQAQQKPGPFLLNLIDTPGHVDFSYEVSRSLAACQGALLLTDAARGVQAQTVATYLMALEQGLEIVPVLTKIDLPGADREKAKKELSDTFGFSEEEVLEVSAKAGVGLGAVVRAVVERVPPPGGKEAGPLRLRLVDAWHDSYRGVVSLVAVVDGVLRRGDRLASCASLAGAGGNASASSSSSEDGSSGPTSSSSSSSLASLSLEALEVGVLAPEPHPTAELRAGQVGYVITGLRDLKAARVGDTWVRRRPAGGGGGGSGNGGPDDAPTNPLSLALPGFRPAKAVVFAGVFPAAADAYAQLSAAVERLTLNDASVSVKKDHSDALGAGFRCGFLGPLHLDVFLQRLEQEHGAEVVASAPSVPVEVDVAVGSGSGSGGRGASSSSSSSDEQDQNGRRRTVRVEAPSDWPRQCRVLEVREPTVVATIVAPSEHCGAVMELAAARRGEQVGHSFLGGSGATASASSSTGRVVLRYILPLAELARGFYSALKQATSGYASLEYEPGEMRPADLRLLEVLVNGSPLDPLARLVHSSEGERAGRALVSRLASLLEREQFDVALQASVAGRVVARETVRARRRDVLAKCYGGDATRKRKLLEKQKEGKSKLRKFGSVRVSADLFPQLLKPLV
jgi:small GTP-binding protein